MKISIWAIGKSHEPFIKTGVEDFSKRIGHYYKIDWNIIPVPKNAGMMSELDLKKKEGDMILGFLKKEDYLIALDERGKQFSSEKFASFLQTRANDSSKNLVFLIGGAFGIDEPVLKRAGLILSLSNMTFPHQLVRLILAEQIYRACTILRNERYHHA